MEKETKIFGIRTVIEAIRSNKAIDKVYLQNGLNGELSSESSIESNESRNKRNPLSIIIPRRNFDESEDAEL